MERLRAFPGAYPGAHGSPELREAIARMLGLQPGEVIVTNGSGEAIQLVYRGLLAAGDLVSIVDPGYGPLRSLATQQGAKIAGVALDEAAGWSLSPAGWDALL